MRFILEKVAQVAWGIVLLASVGLLIYVLATSGSTGDYCSNPQTDTEVSECREEAIQSNRYK